MSPGASGFFMKNVFADARYLFKIEEKRNYAVVIESFEFNSNFNPRCNWSLKLVTRRIRNSIHRYVSLNNAYLNDIRFYHKQRVLFKEEMYIRNRTVVISSFLISLYRGRKFCNLNEKIKFNGIPKSRIYC